MDRLNSGQKKHSSGSRSLTINESMKMRKIYSFMVAAFATLAAISCTQELNTNTPATPEVTGETVVFTAYTDGADMTKTTLSGTTSSWNSGDRIWILNGKAGDSGWKKAYSTTSTESKAIFSEEDNSYPLEGEQYFAVYPAEAAGDATWEGNDVLGVKLIEKQVASLGTYDPMAHIAVAKSTTTSLAFKNAVSLLKFSVMNEDVTSVTVYANEGGILTGFCNVSAEGNVTPWNGEGESNNWVELNVDDGTFEVGEDKDYYIAVFPSSEENTLTAGFTVEFSFSGGSKLPVISYTKSLTLNRNEILDLGDLEYKIPEVVLPEFEAWEGYVYMQPNSNWLADGARFAAYFFGNGETWVDMEQVGEHDIYGCKIPEGYPKVIFCRMNPGAAANNWDNKWNQTEDLTIDGVVYTIPDGAWDNGQGTWTSVETTTPPIMKQDRNLAFEKSSVSVVLGETFTNNLTGYTDGVEYSSSNEEVATIDEKGTVTTLKEGTITITASALETSEYKAGKVSYTLTVTKEQDNNLYLKPNSNWKSDNARFAAYFFGNGEKWVSMTKVQGETDLYSVEKQEGYPKVIFCRMNPGAAANNWDNKWNQTGDLTIPTDGKNLFTLPNGWWDGATETWSVK